MLFECKNTTANIFAPECKYFPETWSNYDNHNSVVGLSEIQKELAKLNEVI